MMHACINWSVNISKKTIKLKISNTNFDFEILMNKCKIKKSINTLHKNENNG